MIDWMKNIPDETFLSEINLPGTHNSATRLCDFPVFSKCQELSIFEQLCIGVRFLDLRVEKTGNRLRLVHASAKCRKAASNKAFLMLEDVLTQCTTFLKTNTSETIVLSIKCDWGESSEITFDTFFETYMKEGLWYKENRIPQLFEVRGKMVFFNRFSVDCENEEYTDLNTGLNFSGWRDQGRYTGETHLVSVMVRRDETAGEPVCIQDWYKLSPKKKWRNAVFPTLKDPPCKYGVFVSFFSCGTLMHNPKRCAVYINKRFLKTDLVPTKKYGWLIFDFINEKICRKVVLTNF